MITAYFVVSGILLCIWLIFVVGIMCMFASEGDWSDFREFSAVMSGIFVAIVIWPAVIPLAIVGFVFFGLTMGMKWLIKGGV